MKNEMVTCIVCGKQKSRSEMSKSYPHRCKECVAARTKEVRRAAKDENRSQQSKVIDWEQRRYEIARSVLAAFLPGIQQQFLMHVNGMKNADDVKFLLKQIKAVAIETSVALVDALIAELKKGSEQ